MNKPITITTTILGEKINQDVGEHLLNYFEGLIEEDLDDCLGKNEQIKLKNFRKLFVDTLNNINNTDSSILEKFLI